MRKLILFFLTFPLLCFADSLDSYKDTCKDIGFKPGTEKFGDCVLKLRKKDVEVQNQNNAQQQQNAYMQHQLEIQKAYLEEQRKANIQANKNANLDRALRAFQSLQAPSNANTQNNFDYINKIQQQGIDANQSKINRDWGTPRY